MILALRQWLRRNSSLLSNDGPHFWVCRPNVRPGGAGSRRWQPQIPAQQEFSTMWPRPADRM
jgi:hypothetical protein